jgi:hypothetical protein
MADGTMLDPNTIPVEGGDLQGMQVDGGYATPPNEIVHYTGGGDDFSRFFFSQVDAVKHFLSTSPTQSNNKLERLSLTSFLFKSSIRC